MNYRRTLPSQRVLREILDYDPISGTAIWKNRSEKHFSSIDKKRSVSNFNTNIAGSSAYAKGTGGYSQIQIRVPSDHSFLDGNFLAHRIIWQLVHGDVPFVLDHINGDRTDNRLLNLRDGSGGLNSKNMKLHCGNTSGVPGVYRCSKTGAWSAQIHMGEKFQRLGRFATFNEAVAARKAAEKVLGYHKNHGRLA